MSRESKREAYKALERWQHAHKNECTRAFDGICRCSRDERRFDRRPLRVESKANR